MPRLKKFVTLATAFRLTNDRDVVAVALNQQAIVSGTAVTGAVAVKVVLLVLTKVRLGPSLLSNGLVADCVNARFRTRSTRL